MCRCEDSVPFVRRSATFTKLASESVVLVRAFSVFEYFVIQTV